MNWRSFTGALKHYNYYLPSVRFEVMENDDVTDKADEANDPDCKLESIDFLFALDFKSKSGSTDY